MNLIKTANRDKNNNLKISVYNRDGIYYKWTSDIISNNDDYTSLIYVHNNLKWGGRLYL